MSAINTKNRDKKSITIIRYNLYFLKFVGVWSDDDNDRSEYLHFIKTFFIALSVSLPQIAYVIRQSDNILDISETLAPASSTIMAILKFVVIYIYRKRLQSFIVDLQKIYDKTVDVEYKNILKLANKESQILVVFYFILMSYIVVNFSWMPLILMLYKKIAGIPIINLILPLKVDYGVNQDENPSYGLLYTWILINMTVMTILITAIDCVFVSLILHVKAHLIILRKNIEKIGFTKNTIDHSIEYKKRNWWKFLHKIKYYVSEERALKQLKMCIQQHNVIIQNVHKLEMIFTYQSMIQFISTSLTICLILFQASVSIGDLKQLLFYFVFLIGTFVQLYMFAKYGQLLLNESVQIADAAYGSPWFVYGQKFRKPLILLIQRSQKPLGITAAKFYYVSVESFSKILGAAASYFMLLQTVNEKTNI